MTWKRVSWILIGGAAGVVVAALAIGIFVLQSGWFHRYVRSRILETVETATGGRAEIGSFRFDWHAMRAEALNFTLHGTEPPDGPALFHADAIAVGLKVVSIMERTVDIAYLDVAAPHVYLIVQADGRTNVPEPKVHRNPDEPPLEPILNLAVGRFGLTNGIFEIASRGKTPFDLRGNNLDTRLDYDPAGPQYRGRLSMRPLAVQFAGFQPVPMDFDAAVTMERDRIAVSSGRLAWAGSRVAFSGAVEHLVDPRVALQYDASVAVPGLARTVRIPELQAGTMQLRGSARWDRASGPTAKGTLHGTGLAYRDQTVHLVNFRADGEMTAGAGGIEVDGLRLSGQYVTGAGRAAIDGLIARSRLRERDLEIGGIQLTLFGGHFSGEARVRNLRQYEVKGEIAAIEARSVVAMYSHEHLPWNAVASGAVQASGDFLRPRELRTSATLAIAPAPDSAPVRGRVAATYQGRDGTLDLGHSSMILPSSQVDFSGAIPAVPGRPMRVRLETRDLNDLLPAIDVDAASLPARLTGTAAFEGAVTGNLETPQIVGRVHVTGITAPQGNVDSLEADAEVSPSLVRLHNAVAARGAMRVRFQIAVALKQWKSGPDDLLAASATVTNAALSDLLPAIGQNTLPLTGTASGSVEVTGTIGNPHVAAEITLTKGTVENEPFDRFTGHVDYTTGRIGLTAGQLAAGGARVSLSGQYQHPPDHFDAGRLHAELRTNAIPLEQFHTLQAQLAGLEGTIEAVAAGDVDLAPPHDGKRGFQVAAVQAELTAHDLRLTGKPLGDMHLTAISRGAELSAHLESNAANTDIHGDGQWRLEGDYPGSATVTFSKLDLVPLRAWLQPSARSAAASFSGSAEGQLRINGPAARPEALKAELRISQFDIAPAADTSLGKGNLALHNSGPIVATMANDVITVESARLVGPSTDLNFAGKVALRQGEPLDLRLNGRVDLALLHTLESDFESSGSLTADATLRGALSDPQINGRVQFQNAAFNLEDIPNGISKANGTILFTKDRATIQNFTGETGGGKVELAGFASWAGGKTIFRLHARATEVRVRYPEGVSTVANANLNLTGESDRSMLSGTVTILRSGFNPQSDFSSLLAKSAQPAETPSARTGLVGGMTFDVQVNTAPDVQFQSSLTQDVQMEANLRLRGTFSNPAVLGRIVITHGRVAFFGTTYNVSNGTVAFYNPVRVEPILDIDLEAKANGIDVTLNISGPFAKPNLTPRSDPPLQFNEIVALLANGRTPTSDPSRLAEESTAPQSWQQMGASALLGQAIASPVAGRLQRFFGVSQVRIDPTLPGVESNPQARLTLQQQVTQDITFTYITNVTQSNPQVVRVEWAFAKQWSAVAVRDENGLFGLDFFYKKRF